MRVAGLLNATTGQVHTWDFSRVTADRLARCFQQIGRLYPRARLIYLVLDNWPVHFHPKVTVALAAEPRIVLLPLPTYSPWLNPIEKLWRWVKQRVTHAHPWCDDFLIFKEQVRTELQRFTLGSPELLDYCGLVKLISI
jgi:transposase